MSAADRAIEQSMNTARWAALAAGRPESVPAVTVDRQCAAQGVLAGAYEVVIASGVESMSTVPIGSQAAGRDPFGPGVAERYTGGLVPQGHQRGTNRSQVGTLARGPGRLRRREPPQIRCCMGQRQLRR
jgi:acetyl-CoA acetyltransferase